MNIIKTVSCILLGIILAVLYFRLIEKDPYPVIITDPQQVIWKALLESEKAKSDSLLRVIHANRQRINSLNVRYKNLEAKYEQYLEDFNTLTDDQHFVYFMERTTRTDPEHH